MGIYNYIVSPRAICYESFSLSWHITAPTMAQVPVLIVHKFEIKNLSIVQATRPSGVSSFLRLASSLQRISYPPFAHYVPFHPVASFLSNQKMYDISSTNINKNCESQFIATHEKELFKPYSSDSFTTTCNSPLTGLMSSESTIIQVIVKLPQRPMSM